MRYTITVDGTACPYDTADPDPGAVLEEVYGPGDRFYEEPDGHDELRAVMSAMNAAAARGEAYPYGGDDTRAGQLGIEWVPDQQEEDGPAARARVHVDHIRRALEDEDYTRALAHVGSAQAESSRALPSRLAASAHASAWYAIRAACTDRQQVHALELLADLEASLTTEKAL